MPNRTETENKLIAAAHTVIIERGFEGCTLERICSQAGFTRGAFYSNFADKEALFTLVVKDEYNRLIEKLAEVSDEWMGEVKAENLTDDETAQVGLYLNRVREKIGLDRNFLILHSELLARAAREPEWALQFMEFNRNFVVGVGNALELMLGRVGRTPTKRGEAIAQGVIGIALRYTGVSVWKTRLAEMGSTHKTRGTLLEAEEILDMILTLLMACSKPAD